MKQTKIIRNFLTMGDMKKLKNEGWKIKSTSIDVENWEFFYRCERIIELKNKLK
jgi:hypothetical protein